MLPRIQVANLTSQPVVRLIGASILLLSLAFLFWSSDSLSNAKHLFKPPPPHEPPRHHPGSPIGSGAHVGEPSSQALREWRKPKDLKVIGLIFYGRKEFVEVLDCYLKRNLVENGGILDEVIFAVHTNITTDLEYLDQLIETSPSYTKYKTEKEYEWLVGSWEKVEQGNLYIKIDDDVVYFEDDAIPAIVKRMVENPHYFAVSANSVNNPALSWVHYGLGVYEPYLPELTPPDPTTLAPNSWRASQLPYWSGPSDFMMNGDIPAPFPGHRWLPVPPSDRDITKTPAGALTFDAYGPGWTDWSIAAQTHYSFLQHVEEGALWRYKFNMWDYQYSRLSVNFIGFWGDDIVNAFPFPGRDDEEYLTVTRPRELGRHVVLDGTVLSVHFAFSPQRKLGGIDGPEEPAGLYLTDLLSRYRAYAEEKVCPFPKRGKDQSKGGFW